VEALHEYLQNRVAVIFVGRMDEERKVSATQVDRIGSHPLLYPPVENVDLFLGAAQ
jgi:hypothetical protein